MKLATKRDWPVVSPAGSASPGENVWSPKAPLVTWAEHGGDRFVAAVENGPLCATQFHPEKSGEAGMHLYERFVKVVAER